MYRSGIGRFSLFSILIFLTLIVSCERSDQIKSGDEDIDVMISKMSLEEKIGQLLMPSLQTWTEENVTDYHLGGVILFKENFENPSQTNKMIQSLQEQAEIPLMIAVDQEGGLVTRIPFIPRMPGNMALGATGDPQLAEEVGFVIGTELRHLGINVNFAPVLDINSNPDNPIIGVRSFGDQPDLVSKFGIAYMKGLNQAGVISVGKHFPGHGDVDADSHLVLPTSGRTLNQLKDFELKPFIALIQNNIPAIMTAHIEFPNIESKTIISKKDGLPIGLPATFSSKLLTDLLRDELGFLGVLFSDAMNMNAVSQHFDPVESAIMAIEAGVDVILMPEHIENVYKGLLEAVHSGRLKEARIDDSVRRILRLKKEYLFGRSESEKTDARTIETMDTQEIEQRVANVSITVLQNDGILPIKIKDEEKLVIIGTDRVSLQRLAEQVQSYHENTQIVLFDRFANYSGKMTEVQNRILSDAAKMIIVTNTRTKEDKDPSAWKIKSIQQAINKGIPSVVISAGNPYDFTVIDGNQAYIAQYDFGEASFKASCEVIFGKRQAMGRLPVSK